MPKIAIFILSFLLISQNVYAWPFESGWNQSLKASSVDPDTSNFDNNLSSADDTVQKALETLDELALGSGDVTAVGNCVSGACFDGTQGTSLTFNNAGGDGVISYDGTDFNIDRSLSLGTAGVRLSGDGDGAITFLGLGDGFDEDLTLNLDDTSNTGVFTSSTSLNRITWTSMDMTVGGDLTISGDDLFMATNTTGAALIADGTNFNPVVISGDVVIGTTGVAAIQANSVALTTDTSGNYAAGDAEAGNALTGDTATAFFSLGTIEHERGGLEADISAYDGLIGITGGATYNQTGTTTQIIIFDGSGAPTSASLSGNATMTNGGVVTVSDLTCTDCINATEIEDIYILNSGDTITGALTLDENASVALDPAGSADGKYTGITVTGTAGAVLAFGDLVVLDVTDSRWELADANSTAAADGDSRGLIGLCVLAAAGDGSATTILLNGIIRADTAFPAFTVTAPVYVSETAGDLVVTQPTTTDVVIRVMGFSLTADEIYFNPSPDYITHT